MGDSMNDLSARESELVALGAAMGSNCVPCIEYHIPEARKAGLSDAQIRAAIEVADRVRQAPARKVLDTACAILGDGAGTAKAAATGRCAAAGQAGGKGCC
jgi:AhpD family alkylhydroperoxidase